ncbi:hypothetical protein CAEBREN_11556 [Caenorhabditis brenneri]|uniref:Uncharacterized protein n=1 Tax=Caenorhabditis brenneri TaxID=135651 RepID=G0PFB0_CAEBE|nr:hypothetical protein CAEBREN_11556 [Caenorhabditis brenneri]
MKSQTTPKDVADFDRYIETKLFGVINTNWVSEEDRNEDHFLVDHFTIGLVKVPYDEGGYYRATPMGRNAISKLKKPIGSNKKTRTTIQPGPLHGTSIHRNLGIFVENCKDLLFSDALIRADGDLESAADELKSEQELLERFLAKYDENHEIWKLIGVINTNWVSEEDRNQDPLHAGSVYKNLGVLVENCKEFLNEIPFAATRDEAKVLIRFRPRI